MRNHATHEITVLVLRQRGGMNRPETFRHVGFPWSTSSSEPSRLRSAIAVALPRFLMILDLCRTGRGCTLRRKLFHNRNDRHGIRRVDTKEEGTREDSRFH